MKLILDKSKSLSEAKIHASELPHRVVVETGLAIPRAPETEHAK